MSLDYNLTNVKEESFKKHEKTAVADTLIWATMTIGIPEITEKNWKTFYDRISFYEKARQAMRTKMVGEGKAAKVEPVYMTPEDVRDFIGLRTNASRYTDKQFLSHIFTCHCQDNLYSFKNLEINKQAEGGEK